MFVAQDSNGFPVSSRSYLWRIFTIWHVCQFREMFHLRGLSLLGLSQSSLCVYKPTPKAFIFKKCQLFNITSVWGSSYQLPKKQLINKKSPSRTESEMFTKSFVKVWHILGIVKPSNMYWALQILRKYLRRSKSLIPGLFRGAEPVRSKG